MSVFLKFLGCEFDEPLFDFEWRFALRQASAVSDPKDVRVDSDRRLTKCCVENDIRRLATDARQ